MLLITFILGTSNATRHFQKLKEGSFLMPAGKLAIVTLEQAIGSFHLCVSVSTHVCFKDIAPS
jgi:hypothetical protein